MNDPQTHFVRLRMEETYLIEHGNQTLSTAKMLERNVTEFLPIALEVGELTEADIEDIDSFDIPEINTSEVKQLFANITAFSYDYNLVEQDIVGSFNTEYETNGAVKITMQL